MPDEMLLERYAELRKGVATSKELAELEAEIVAQAQKRGERLGDRRAFFKNRFGGSYSEYEARSAIGRAGPWAALLYDRLDRGAKITTVLQQLRAAKDEATTRGVDPEEALKRILSNGSTASERKTSLSTQAMHVASRQFRLGVESLAESFIDVMFGSVKTERRDQLISDFKMSLSQLIDEFRTRTASTKAAVRVDGLKRIGVDRFRWACEVFGVKAKFGQPINIKQIGRLRVRRLRDLHPDRNAAEQARHEYAAVNDAFEILRAYATQVAKGRADEQAEEK